MTFVSPVKDGLGVSTLDRTLLCDNRGELFVKELAALEAAEKAKVARVASGTCGLEPIGEVGLVTLWVVERLVGLFFARWQSTCNKLHTYLRHVLYCTAVLYTSNQELKKTLR